MDEDSFIEDEPENEISEIDENLDLAFVSKKVAHGESVDDYAKSLEGMSPDELTDELVEMREKTEVLKNMLIEAKTSSRKTAKIDDWWGFNRDYDSIGEIITYMKQAFSAQDLQHLSEGFEQGADIFDEEFGDSAAFLRDLREYVSGKYGEDGADADIEEAIAGLGY